VALGQLSILVSIRSKGKSKNGVEKSQGSWGLRCFSVVTDKSQGLHDEKKPVRGPKDFIEEMGEAFRNIIVTNVAGLKAQTRVQTEGTTAGMGESRLKNVSEESHFFQSCAVGRHKKKALENRGKRKAQGPILTRILYPWVDAQGLSFIPATVVS